MDGDYRRTCINWIATKKAQRRDRDTVEAIILLITALFIFIFYLLV